MDNIFIDITHLKELRNWVGDQIQDHQKAMCQGRNEEFNRGARYAFDSVGWRLDDLVGKAEAAVGDMEKPAGLTAKQLEILTCIVQDLQKMASDNSVNESIGEESRATYTAREDAFATVLLVLKTCMANKS